MLTEMVNAPILRGVYGLRYSGSANFGGSEAAATGIYPHRRRGIYRWDGGELPVYIDARDFENTAKEALRTHDEALLKRACSLYQGEF